MKTHAELIAQLAATREADRLVVWKRLLPSTPQT